MTQSRIFSDPRWQPFRAADRPFDEAPADMLAASLEIALAELAPQARLARWLHDTLTTARRQLAEGRPDAAAATIDAGLAGPQAPGASA